MQTINTSNINEARKQIQEYRRNDKTGKIAVLSQDEEFNRKALEIRGVNMLIINETLQVRDYSKQRDSSLNESLAKLAAKNHIEIGIQIDEIIFKSDKEKARSLARLKQNVMLCKKAKAKLIFFSERRNYDALALKSVLQVLAASTEQSSYASKN